MSLDTRTQKCNAVIQLHDNKGKKIEPSFDMLGSLAIDYYLILHDKDVDDNGELKTPHYHIVLKSICRHQLNWFLNRLCECFNCSENVVSVRPCDDINRSIQYLIHKNDSKKYQYEPFMIYSNVNDETIANILNMDLSNQDLTYDYLVSISDSCGCNKLLIMKKIGVGRYNTYIRLINEFLQLYTPIYKQKLIKEGAVNALRGDKDE